MSTTHNKDEVGDKELENAFTTKNDAFLSVNAKIVKEELENEQTGYLGTLFKLKEVDLRLKGAIALPPPGS